MQTWAHTVLGVCFFQNKYKGEKNQLATLPNLLEELQGFSILMDPTLLLKAPLLLYFILLSCLLACKIFTYILA
jgi:hypothetical protein